MGPADLDKEDTADGELISLIAVDAEDRIEARGEIENCIWGKIDTQSISGLCQRSLLYGGVGEQRPMTGLTT